MSKLCANCGAEMEDNQQFCSSCGAEASSCEQDILTVKKVATKKEFLKLPENAKIAKEIRGAGIICYICAAITLAVALISGEFASIIDVLLLVGLGLGIHLKSSRACAVILTIYSIINFVLSALGGVPGGYLIIIAGVFGIIYTFKAEKAWKAYKEQ